MCLHCFIIDFLYISSLTSMQWIVFRLLSELENVSFLQRWFLVFCNEFIVLPCLDNFDRYADRTGTAKFSLDDVSEKKNTRTTKKTEVLFKLTLFCILIVSYPLFLGMFQWTFVERWCVVRFL